MVQPATAESAMGDAQPTRPGAPTTGAIEFLSSAAAAVAVLLPALAGLVLWRRLAGALETPLPVPVLASAGVLLAALAAGARLAWRRHAQERVPLLADRLMALLPGGALIGLGVAWSLPGTSVYGLVALWGVIVAEEAWFVWKGGGRQTGGRVSAREPVEPGAPPPAAASASPKVQLPVPQEVPEAGGMIQQLTRSRDTDGTDRLGGWLRARFAGGQRTESIHIAFCPPFARVPRVESTHCGGPTVRVKTAQLLPHGARLDLKLAAAAEETEWVLLEFRAESPPEEPGARS
jgi:hypothetical protein